MKLLEERIVHAMTLLNKDQDMTIYHVCIKVVQPAGKLVAIGEMHLDIPGGWPTPPA